MIRAIRATTVSGDTVVADNAVAPGRRGARGIDEPALAVAEIVKFPKSVASRRLAAKSSAPTLSAAEPAEAPEFARSPEAVVF